MLKFQYCGSKKTVWLIGPTMKVGSLKSNEIPLAEEGVAPLHCYIHINGNNVEVEPIGEHEVYVNEVLVKKKTSLNLGDITRVGTQEFLILDPQSKAAIVPSSLQQAPVSAEATVFRAPASLPAEASGWMLQGLHQSIRNKRYPVDGTMYLGRSQECELHFSHDRLSRKHAELKVIDNVLVLKDLDSSNGTFHNGERIKQAKLRGGDTIAFDKLEFTVIAPSASVVHGSEPENLNQTIVRSALNPEMLRSAASPVSPLKEPVASSSVQKKASLVSMLMIGVAVLVVLLVAAAVFM